MEMVVYQGREVWIIRNLEFRFYPENYEAPGRSRNGNKYIIWHLKSPLWQETGGEN